MTQAFSRWMIGAIVFAWTMLALGVEALACSPVPDYVRPTNFEMVQLADAIVVATPVATGGEEGRGLLFRVTRVIKGPAPDEFGEIFVGFGRTKPSDPNALLEPHPDSWNGGCVRQRFERGGQYVVFLHKRGGLWRIASYPYTRPSEDYHGENSLWVTTIRTYLDIQSRYEPMEQMATLQALLDKELPLPQTPVRMERERDLVVALAALSPRSPTPKLIAAYEALERGETPVTVRLTDADRFRLFPDMPRRRPVFDADDTDRGLRSTLSFLVKGDHPGAASLFERLIASDRPKPSDLGLAIRFFAKNGQYRRSYALVEDRALGMLVGMPKGEAEVLISDIISAQWGDEHEEGKERWRSDPYTLAAWPELALRLYWFHTNNLDPGSARSFAGGLETLKITDYRARPDATLALASTYNEALRAWAAAEVLDEAKRRAWETSEHEHDAEDPALLPLSVLMRGIGEERDEVLDRVFCQGGDRRLLLFKTFGRWARSYDIEYALRLAAWPSYDEEERAGLARAVLANGTLSIDQATDVFRGEPIDLTQERFWTGLKPITCPGQTTPKAP